MYTKLIETQSQLHKKRLTQAEIVRDMFYQDITVPDEAIIDKLGLKHSNVAAILQPLKEAGWTFRRNKYPLGYSCINEGDYNVSVKNGKTTKYNKKNDAYQIMQDANNSLSDVSDITTEATDTLANIDIIGSDIDFDNVSVEDLIDENTLLKDAKEEEKARKEQQRQKEAEEYQENIRKEAKREAKYLKLKEAEFEKTENAISFCYKVRQNTLLYGPTGCGKTYLAQKIAEEMGLEVVVESVAAGLAQEDLIGKRLPDSTGSFSYFSSEFVRLYGNGGVYIADEIDAADPEILLVLNNALAGDHFTVGAKNEGERRVNRHKDFIFVGTCNTLDGADINHNARQKLDGASLSRLRCGVIEMDYDKEYERKVITDKKLLSWGWAVRKYIEDNSGFEDKVMDTRFLKDAQRMLDAGAPLSFVQKRFFVGWEDSELASIKIATDNIVDTEEGIGTRKDSPIRFFASREAAESYLKDNFLKNTGYSVVYNTIKMNYCITTTTSGAILQEDGEWYYG